MRDKRFRKRKERKTEKKKRWASGWEEAVGVVEVVLILAVIIGLIVIFRTQLTGIVNRVFESVLDTLDGIL